VLSGTIIRVKKPTLEKSPVFFLNPQERGLYGVQACRPCSQSFFAALYSVGILEQSKGARKSRNRVVVPANQAT